MRGYQAGPRWGQPPATLATLVLAAPRAVETSALCDASWGDQPPADPGRDVRSIISRLRAVLGPPSILTVKAVGYRSSLPREALDVAELQRAMALSRRPHFSAR